TDSTLRGRRPLGPCPETRTGSIDGEIELENDAPRPAGAAGRHREGRPSRSLFPCGAGVTGCHECPANATGPGWARPGPGQGAGVDGNRWSPDRVQIGSSLDLDGGAGVLQFLLELLGILLGDAGLDLLGRRLDQVLGLLEAQAGGRANHL